MVLEAIISHKRDELAARKRDLPLERLRQDLQPSPRSLLESLKKPSLGYILELKKASPSRGTIRRNFDPAHLAKIYEPYASGVSVLADSRFFEGRLEYVRDVAGAVQIPVLLKDFIIDPYQVYEARRYGANAVLLMLSVLDDREFGRCFEAVQKLKMDALVEVHNEKELQRALVLGAEIIGINNRDLKTLDVDLATTERLAPLLPRDKIVIAESGIRDHRDTLRLRDLVSGFLVGSSLMAREDLGRATKELIFGSVKVCGLTREADAVWAGKSGAVYGGMIFAHESPRVVDMNTARQLSKNRELDWVGVFRNHDLQQVFETASALDLPVVQLHGEEDADYIRRLKERLGHGKEIWKALRIDDRIPDLKRIVADRILLDSYRRGVPGGTGHSFDWSLLREQGAENLVLGGGLGPKNAAAADAVGASILDVNSGLESEPGIKDSELITRFFEELRGRGRS